MSKSQSFLCPRCKKVMCQDCINIAEEYQELHDRRKFELIRLQEENAELKRKLALAEQRAADYERVAKLGYPEVIQSWIDHLATNKP
jgi:glutaredoxin-related protein